MASRQASLGSVAVGEFFIDTSSGQVATHRQLRAAGIVSGGDPPAKPWLRVQGPGDASTMWYAVMRKRTKGVFIGTLTLRHGGHYPSLRRAGWEEVPVDQIGRGLEGAHAT
jgi:hypothetical protein